jgi:chromosome segregation ATPase
MIAAATQEQPEFIGLFVSSVISAAVLSAAIAGLVAYLNNRRNARIAERKNTADEDNDLVTRYQTMATEERSAKESAVKTVRELLAIAEAQIASLQGTITRLTETITVLQHSAQSQQELIESITAERDRLKHEQEKLQHDIDAKSKELLNKQAEILELSYPSAAVRDIRSHMKENNA